MATWHGYFVAERLNVGAGNWAALKAMFEAMGTGDSDFPAHNNHWRTRLDGNAVIYESLFDPDAVSILAFKQLLADTFGVPVENIQSTIGNADYAGYGTTVWVFYYDEIVPGEDRFKVERFGGGGTWPESRAETLGYLAENAEDWEVGE